MQRIISVKVDLLKGDIGQIKVHSSVECYGKIVGCDKQFYPNEFKANFDIIWESIGQEIKEYYLDA